MRNLSKNIKLVCAYKSASAPPLTYNTNTETKRCSYYFFMIICLYALYLREPMIIKQYNTEYLEILAALFCETVHSVNAQNYTTKQLFAWAPNTDSLKI